jgi:hypothetical protein
LVYTEFLSYLLQTTDCPPLQEPGLNREEGNEVGDNLHKMELHIFHYFESRAVIRVISSRKMRGVTM